MPKVDIESAPVRTGSGYPEPYKSHCAGRSKCALGDPGGLTQFGVNLTRLKPGAASAQQHWHKNEDELVYMLEGEAVLVEEGGETVLRAGDVATFKASVPVGHMLVNRGGQDAVFLEIGTRAAEEVCTYTDPNVDLQYVREVGGWKYLRKNGQSY